MCFVDCSHSCCSRLQVKLERLQKCLSWELLSIAFRKHSTRLGLGDTSIFQARQLVSEASLPRLLYLFCKASVAECRSFLGCIKDAQLRRDP